MNKPTMKVVELMNKLNVAARENGASAAVMVKTKDGLMRIEDVDTLGSAIVLVAEPVNLKPDQKD